MAKFNDNQYWDYPHMHHMHPVHRPMPSISTVGDDSEYDALVISSMGEGPKGDKGDPTYFDDLTDEQLAKIYQNASFVGNKSIDAVVTTTGTSTSNITIPFDYDDFDMLFIDVNGLDLSEGDDYTITGNLVSLVIPLPAGQDVHFRALKYDLIDGNKNIVNTMGRKDYNTVAEMKADMNLEAGDICHTLGFYTPGDGGAAWYVVHAHGVANGMDVILLNNDLLAVLKDESNEYNVMQYGFKVNAISNDNTAIIEHILSVKNGGTILLPYGTVYLDETDLVPGKIFTFKGFGESYDGNRGTAIHPAGDSQNYLFKGDSNGMDYYTFTDISFNGDNSCQYGLYCPYATGFLVDRCSFDSFVHTACLLGLGLNNVRNSLIRVPDDSECALLIHSDSYITNCEIVGGKNSLVVEASGIRLTSCLLYSGSEHSIYVNPTVRMAGETAQANNLMVDGCYFGDCGSAHVYIPHQNCNNIIIANSYFEMTLMAQDESGVYCKSTKTININNCVFLGYDESNTNAAIELNTCEYCVITSNRILNYEGFGIKLTDTTDCIISSNSIRNTQNNMIELAGTSVRNNINGNVLMNTNAVKSINLAGTCRNNIIYGNQLGTSYTIDSTINMFKNFQNTRTAVEMEVTLDGTPTLNSVSRTDNGIVNVCLTTPVMMENITSGKHIGTLPSGYRPPAQIFVLNSVTGSNNQPFYIESNGKIYAQFSANSGTTPIRLCFSFALGL